MQDKMTRLQSELTPATELGTEAAGATAGSGIVGVGGASSSVGVAPDGVSGASVGGGAGGQAPGGAQAGSAGVVAGLVGAVGTVVKRALGW